jgi:hypothetical protein
MAKTEKATRENRRRHDGSPPPRTLAARVQPPFSAPASNIHAAAPLLLLRTARAPLPLFRAGVQPPRRRRSRAGERERRGEERRRW